MGRGVEGLSAEPIAPATGALEQLDPLHQPSQVLAEGAPRPVKGSSGAGVDRRTEPVHARGGAGLS